MKSRAEMPEPWELDPYDLGFSFEDYRESVLAQRDQEKADVAAQPRPEDGRLTLEDLIANQRVAVVRRYDDEGNAHGYITTVFTPDYMDMGKMWVADLFEGRHVCVPHQEFGLAPQADGSWSEQHLRALDSFVPKADS